MKPHIKMKTKQVNIIEVSDWDNKVQEIYGKPYSFQQQDGCKERGVFEFKVPMNPAYICDYENDTIPPMVNGEEMGVSFKGWLNTDSKKPLPGSRDDRDCTQSLIWERNLYPDVSMIIEDLHSKGELKEGDYLINIDW